ncbi:MAG: DUF2177 family protein [Candidatus Absconditabacterales bacterium]
MQYIIVYFISLFTLCVLDYVWLGVIMKSAIAQWFGPLMREQILRGPALAFYVLYTIAVVVFAIYPAYREQSWYMAAGYGALLGFTAYMTYDLTNWATLKSRPVAMVAPDIVWGTIVTALVALVGYMVWTRYLA